MKKSAKHLFFDLDDTITLSRSPIEPDGYELFKALSQDIIVISGAQLSQIEQQVLDLPFYRLGQNGNQALHKNGVPIWNEKLCDQHERIIREHIDAVRDLCTFEVQDTEDLVEHRGAQISYSLIGHNCPIEHKKAFDPDRVRRTELLAQIPLESEHVEVKIGGTTCFDYFEKGKHKGFNVSRLIAHERWDPDECIYFGDALTPGGNDETVIGVIETVLVRNHLHTYELLREHFL